MSSYQPGVPTGSVPLNQDYLNLQGNFTSLNNQWLVNHVALTNTSGTPPNGYHTIVNIYANSKIEDNTPDNYPIIPPPIAGFSGTFFTTQSNDGINPDEILWYLSGGGKLTQMTRNMVTSNSNTTADQSNGATFLPGGLILNWGIYNAPGGSFSSGSTTNASAGQSALTLTQSLPNNLYLVGGNLLYSASNLPSSSGTLNVRASQLNAGTISTLSWQVYANTNNYTGFVWWALGA